MIFGNPFGVGFPNDSPCDVLKLRIKRKEGILNLKSTWEIVMFDIEVHDWFLTRLLYRDNWGHP